ncbi:MAG TPA: ABC transporter permease [Dehalococcoidia bacterium]|jgi:peptide/nickel transport system permease protein|nr:ABC transporter permease [Dehalococcoidia bacterium]
MAVTLPTDEAFASQPILRQSTWRRSTSRAIKRNPVGAVSGLICLFLILLVFLGPTLSPYSASDISFTRLQAPTLSHPFGTDNLARDLLSRIFYGARNSLGVSFAAIAVSTALGILFGVASGYIGGWTDLATSRMLDVMLAYPALIFVIFFISIFGRDFLAISIAIGLVLMPGTARIVRSATIAVRHQQYIEAAEVTGNSHFRIMWRHVLPNIAAPIIVVMSIQIGVAILIEAAISFLGFGVSSATDPSWGRMLSELRPSWQLGWWTMIFPGLAISIAVIAFNIFGDALRDWLDPRLRGSR